MNYLFHMLLSGDDDQLLVGNFMGDFVKGPLAGRFSPRVRHGVFLHRRIDSYADSHPVYRTSRLRLAQEYGRYRGVMLDIFYDHILANEWDSWCDEPLDGYLSRTRKIIERHMHEIPAEMHRLIAVIFDELLPSYGSMEGIGAALSRLSRRLARANPLHGSEKELLRCHDELRDDFRIVTPDLFHYAAEIAARPYEII
jgi:acyl carrier protein phosphodiesterase